MASTGVNFSLTRNGIIKKAFELLNVYGADESPSSKDYGDAAEWLNMIIKFWQTSGVNLISRETAYLFLDPATTTYTISNTGDHCTSSYEQTSISADEAAGQTTISLTDTTNITAADYIGITLDDGTRHWSTVTSKTSTTVLIPDALPSAASEDNVVVTYTTKIDRPLQIFNAFRRDLTTSNDTMAKIRSESEYTQVYNKEQAGIPTQVFYNPGNDEGTLKVWMIPDTAQYALGISYKKMIEDYDTGSSVSQFPNEWLLPLAYNLAYYMSPVYGKWVEQSKLQAIATMLFNKVQSYNQEDTSIYVSTVYDDHTNR